MLNETQIATLGCAATPEYSFLSCQRRLTHLLSHLFHSLRSSFHSLRYNGISSDLSDEAKQALEGAAGSSVRISF